MHSIYALDEPVYAPGTALIFLGCFSERLKALKEAEKIKNDIRKPIKIAIIEEPGAPTDSVYEPNVEALLGDNDYIF